MARSVPWTTVALLLIGTSGVRPSQGAETGPGLRPVALCVSDPHVRDGLNGLLELPPLTPDYPAPDGSTDYAHMTPGVVHHVTFTATQCSYDSSVSGNFGWVDLDSGRGSPWTNNGSGRNPPDPTCADPAISTSACGTSDWLRYGWFGPVRVSPSGDCDAVTAGQQECLGDTGTSGSSGINLALSYLMNPASPTNTCGPGSTCDPLTFPITLFSRASASGSNAEFQLVGIAQVRLWGYQLSGNSRYLDLEFMGRQLRGECCPPSWP